MPEPIQPSAGVAGTEPTAIEVQTSYAAMAVFLAGCKPHIRVDGVTTKAPWGSTTIAVTPGHHELEVWVNYYGAPDMGRNSLTIDAGPGTVTTVSWRAPWMALLKGKMAITGVVGPPSGPKQAT